MRHIWRVFVSSQMSVSYTKALFVSKTRSLNAYKPGKHRQKMLWLWPKAMATLGLL
jgi:hypothetical protein